MIEEPLATESDSGKLPQAADYAELTDPGLKRTRNEDAVLSLPEHGLFCVSDGVGGAMGGEVASQAVVESLTHEFAELPGKPGSQEWEVRLGALRKAAQGANTWILKRANEWSARGMGATLVGLMLDRKWPEKAMVFHAGDSRAYRWRDDVLTCLTLDHTVASLLKGQNIAGTDNGVGGMLVRAVGAGDGLVLDETALVVMPGDLYLLCSDGLTKMVPEKKQVALFKKHAAGELAGLAAELVNAAKAAGGSDNVSVVLVRPVFPAAGTPGPLEVTRTGSAGVDAHGWFDKLLSKESPSTGNPGPVVSQGKARTPGDTPAFVKLPVAAIPAGNRQLHWVVGGLVLLILVMLAAGMMMNPDGNFTDKPAVVQPSINPDIGRVVLPPVTPSVSGPAVVPPVTPGGTVVVTSPVVPPGVAPPAPAFTPEVVAALKSKLEAKLTKALASEDLESDQVKDMLKDPTCYVRAPSQSIDFRLVAKDLVVRRVQIKDVFELLGKPRVGIHITERMVDKDGNPLPESRIDRFRTAMKNQLEAQYKLVVVDVSGEAKADQKAQCDILISGDVEVAYFAEMAPPDAAAMGETAVMISYNTGVKVRFLNAFTSQELDSNAMTFEPKANVKYMGRSQADAVKKSVQGAINALLPEWLKKIEDSWVTLCLQAADKPVAQ